MSQALPPPPGFVFPSLDIIRITQTLQDEGEHPKLCELWKTSVEFSRAHSHAATGRFLSV